MDYGTLIGPKENPGSIRSWINYGLIDAEGVLLDAQSYLYGTLRVREMRSEAPLTIAQGVRYVALPTNFLDPITCLYTDGSGEIVQKTEQAVLRSRAFNEDGTTLAADQPRFYGIWDERLNFEVQSDAAYAATMLYYKRPAYLASTAQAKTNFLTNRYPALLRSACLMFAADYRDDGERYARWLQRTQELVARANVENELSRRGSLLSE